MALERTAVIRAALRVLDDVGLEKLTLRRIASELDVQAPALYWHFANKQELLDAMATTVLVDAARGGDWTGLGWEDLLRAYADGVRAALLRYRDGAKMVPGTYLTDDSMYGVMERALQVLTSAGFSAETAALALTTVYSYTVGSAIEEQAVYPRPGEREYRYDPATRDARIDAAEQPTVAALNESYGPSDVDRHFARGLALIITGLAAELPGEPAEAPDQAGNPKSSDRTRV